MLQEELKKRGIPDLLTFENGEKVTAETWPRRREEILRVLKSELYGELPELSFRQSCRLRREENRSFMGGKAVVRDMEITIESPAGNHSWPLTVLLPKKEEPVPMLVHIAFPRFYPVDMVPAEEIVDRGFGLCTFLYTDVTTDDDDFTDGMAGLFYPDGKRGEHDAGKIAIWAWAASRAVDELMKMPDVDPDRLAVIGQSRLGKTALWAGAQDTRFAAVIPVQSGCSGAAIARGKTGETVRQITDNFGYQFAPAYRRYAGQEDRMPFDQHFPLALAAPRKLYVTSASEDLWSDPLGEYLGCEAVSPVYALLGGKPLEETEELKDDMRLNGGDVGYCRTAENHYFSREDWMRACDFLEDRTR